MIVLGPANRVDLISPPAEAWLTGLGVELGDAWSTVLPGEVYAIASQARRLGAGHFDAGPAVSRVATADGDKVDLHAALLEGEPQGPVAVIVEPPPHPRLAEPITSAYELSEEEADTVHNALVARPTDVLPPEIDEKLAPVLARLGVADRTELVAKVFAEHYALRLERGQAVGPDGWFDGEIPDPPEPAPPDPEAADPEAADASQNGHAPDGVTGAV